MPSSEDLESLRANPRHWKYGIIYYCASDPRIVIAKRIRWQGWTLNYAHRTAYLFLAVIVLAAVIPSLTVIREGQPHRVPEMLLLSSIFVAVLILAATKIGRY